MMSWLTCQFCIHNAGDAVIPWLKYKQNRVRIELAHNY